MRSTVLIREGSFLTSPRTGGVHYSGAWDSFLRQNTSSLLYPRCQCATAIHLEAEGGGKGSLLRRAKADLVGSSCCSRAGIRAPILEKVAKEEDDDLPVKWCDLGVSVPAGLAELMEYSGGGTGKGKNVGRGRSGGDADRDDNRRISEYYQQLLETDPVNPLLLRNYGRFLHEAEGDAVSAEECYGRAILASPGDGEVLSLYGKLVWETHRDEERAESYFNRAVKASPDDCYVLGSYAPFLWGAGEEGEEEAPPARRAKKRHRRRPAVKTETSSPSVEAF